MQLHHLTINGPRRDAFAQALEAVHLCLDKAAPVIATPLLLDAASQTLAHPNGLVARPRAQTRLRPMNGVPVRRYHRHLLPPSDGVKADSHIVGAIGADSFNGRDEGVTKLLFDDSPEAHGHGRILGGGIVGTHAGDMIGEIALAIEMGADAVDIGKTIHPHPTLGESLGMAAEVAHGSCTDVPPTMKR